MKILRVASLFLVSVVITAGAQLSFAQSALLRVTLDSRSLAVSAADEAYKDFSLRVEKLGTSTFAIRQKAGLSKRGTPSAISPPKPSCGMGLPVSCMEIKMAGTM